MNVSKGSVLLIGSVSLRSVDEVLEVTARELGGSARRLVDGEAGGWCNIPADAIGRSQGFEAAPAPPGWLSILAPPARLAAGVAPADVKFAPSGYVEIAKSSYAIFKKMRAAGTIPATTRFQQSLPTPLAAVFTGVVPENVMAVLPHFENSFLGEVAQITEAIPHADLAIQWDLAGEVFGVLENQEPALAKHFTPDALAERVSRLCNAIPGDIECGMHLCYGQADAKNEAIRADARDVAPAHVPTDTAKMVDLTNRIFARLRRALTWVHVPVPIARDDPGYFRPLKDLKLPDNTELYLGVVHLKDGLEGAKRRIAAAKTAVPSFGVATECGLRLIPTERIREILQVHREAAHIAA